MDVLYNQTNKLIQHTQQRFKVLEGNVVNANEIEVEIAENITQIQRNCEKLDLYVHKLPLEQRQNGKMRCDQLKYDNRHMQAALEAAKQRRLRRETAASEREQLLSRRFAPNPDLTAINIDYSVQHQNSLHNAHRGVDEMLYTGSNTLDSLRSQRSTLKGAHKRIIDMANVLGVSNHTMRLIEKRVSEDKVVFAGGVLTTFVVIILVIVYLT
ncbi:probable Golgi SNAP receptor complex member 2 [Anthonomus grandis grandis]|uniref:probable Golgi SNAP receptor complex member 2 n=1 Tax=Anthonomus grandis grandis TaxID=2921223 RepID=UPI002166A773|nr:probable Golgi SNAP receptor complex member 2 [Anthonomus grandis grandis]